MARQARKGEKRCLTCGKPSRRIVIIGDLPRPPLDPRLTDDGPFFCTIRCAAHYGRYVAARDYSWCSTHGDWFLDDTCPDCDEEQRRERSAS